MEPVPAPPEEPKAETAAASPAPANQAMDVVAPPPSPATADSAADPEAAPDTPAIAETKPAPAPAKPQKESNNGVTVAIIGTVIIVLTLAALATFAYLQTAK